MKVARALTPCCPAKGPLEPFDYDPGPPGPQQVDVRVTTAGFPGTDSAMVDNDYGFDSVRWCPGTRRSASSPPWGRGRWLRVGQRVGGPASPSRSRSPGTGPLLMNTQEELGMPLPSSRTARSLARRAAG